MERQRVVLNWLLLASMLAERASEVAMQIYRGQCHCGEAQFEIEAEIDHVRECDCSVCRRRGALNFRVPPDAIRFLTPLSRLSVYRWGSRTAADYFCPECGVMLFRQPSAPTPEEQIAGAVRFEGWAVNVRCIDGFDLDAVPRIRIYGSQLKLQDVAKHS